VVEYGDYQCPACGTVHPNLKQLVKDYDGKVTFYFRNFPLTSLHPNANAAANAAEAAAGQNKFWEMHDKLYETQKNWSSLAANDAEAKFADYAKELGLDVDVFKKALANKQFQSVIDQDSADANAMGVSSTPTIYINGVQQSGKTDYASLRDAVEAELNKK
jgi:protein-disulfide isomerase